MALIVIEGLDGSGKSTQINRLNEYLTSLGRKCRPFHFPRTDSPVYGELIARFLRGELGDSQQVNPYLVSIMFAEDRFDFKPVLEKWLSDDEMVLLDRYIYSNVAYQCAKVDDLYEKNALRKWILHLEYEYHKLPKPDVNIFLDVPFAFTQRQLKDKREGGDRQYLQGKQDIHEADLNFQKNVRDMYLSMSDDKNFVIIDCSDGDTVLPVDQIFNRIINVLNDQLILL